MQQNLTSKNNYKPGRKSLFMLATLCTQILHQRQVVRKQLQRAQILISDPMQKTSRKNFYPSNDSQNFFQNLSPYEERKNREKEEIEKTAKRFIKKLKITKSKLLEKENYKNIDFRKAQKSVKEHEINKGPWTEEEDNLLRELVEFFGPRNWSYISNIIRTRIGKQCRERWHNHLDPTINKKSFSDDEKQKILQLHKLHGNKWSLIAMELPGRTDNSVKNFWYSQCKKGSKMN
ncbi:MYB3R-1 [Ecytonucleospora hepatopenaei]|uniref:MYB3R-1 n=1 Tax=Ecytonucleospora hepatopenaei TaxID=646526 RepID=A0A1W0E809_9MICR|nr:MYB3R-1 [Ecytonucleospora hepatopenaei]